MRRTRGGETKARTVGGNASYDACSVAAQRKGAAITAGACNAVPARVTWSSEAQQSFAGAANAASVPGRCWQHAWDFACARGARQLLKHGPTRPAAKSRRTPARIAPKAITGTIDGTESGRSQVLVSTGPGLDRPSPQSSRRPDGTVFSGMVTARTTWREGPAAGLCSRSTSPPYRHDVHRMACPSLQHPSMSYAS